MDLSSLKEIKQLGLESIKNMNKTRLKMMVNHAIKETTFTDMVKKKESHSKVKNIIHKRLEIQGYLKPNKIRMKIEEAQEFFRMRGRVTELKTNFKGKYESFECDACKIEDETQKHIIECKEINKEKKKIKKYQNLKNYIKEMYKIN